MTAETIARGANPRIRDRVDPRQLLDPQYAALIHLADTPLLAGRLEPFLWWDGAHLRGVMKEEALRASGAWSHGEQILLKIALDLFDPGCVVAAGHANPGWGEVAGTLSTEPFRAAVAALTIARGVAEGAP